MKPAHIFRDQVNTVAQWFDQWNDIEQTIACYSLLKRLGPTQARFLSLVLDHTFRDSASEVQVLEEEANGKGIYLFLSHKNIMMNIHKCVVTGYFMNANNKQNNKSNVELCIRFCFFSFEKTQLFLSPFCPENNFNSVRNRFCLFELILHF